MTPSITLYRLPSCDWFSRWVERGGDVPKRVGVLSTVGLTAALMINSPEVSTIDSLLETFDQDKSGTITFREFVAGLAPLAAKRKKEEGSFYERAAAELKENILKQDVEHTRSTFHFDA
eukprot:5468688-Pyramimonas_sp.AAC.1